MVPNFEDELDVVVGSGSSGCATALASHNHGFRTGLLKKGAVAGAGYQIEENLRNYIENDPLALEYFAGLG